MENPNPVFNKKKVCFLAAAVLAGIVLAGALLAVRTQMQMKQLFRLNKELQDENYYMAEFEFKMLGIAYHLSKGRYLTSLSMINWFHSQLQNRAGLIKMPVFINRKAEYEFYRNLQNPRTGAFMDDAYPLCTYHGPTENVLLHLEALARETGQPLRLKYPLRYLDEINTPQKLVAYLNDVSTVGWLASKLPQTTFHNARDVLGLAKDSVRYREEADGLVFERNGLYHFPGGWKRTMLRWFWENQDPGTGLWGPKSKDGRLWKKDVSNTSSILKAFVDREGNNIHASFPLRYRKELFASVLETLTAEMPGSEALDEWHEWRLKTPKGIRLLTRYLWGGATVDQKRRARKVMEDYVHNLAQNCYVPAEGAFSYYPSEKHATLDGTGGFFFFGEVGAFSVEKQSRLWGSPQAKTRQLPSVNLSKLTPESFDVIARLKGVNALRFYRNPPNYGDLAADVFAVAYPRKPTVLDVIDLTPKVKNWVAKTPQTMGNWVSKATLRQRLRSIYIQEAPVYIGTFPLEGANAVLARQGELHVIGFDILQIPRYRIVYAYP